MKLCLLLVAGTLCAAEHLTPVETKIVQSIEASAGESNLLLEKIVNINSGTFNAAAGPESIAIRGQFLARDQQLMLELLADALLRPRFKLEELENLRARQILVRKNYNQYMLLRKYFTRLLIGPMRSIVAAEATLEGNGAGP